MLGVQQLPQCWEYCTTAATMLGIQSCHNGCYLKTTTMMGPKKIQRCWEFNCCHNAGNTKLPQWLLFKDYYKAVT